MRRILILTTGGTIASRAGGAVTTEEVVQQLSSLVPEVNCTVVPVCQLGSSQLTLAVMWDLAHRVHRAQASGLDGVVITHGTDTMEETAFFLDLVVGEGPPVVLTGAMRQADAAGFDGWANLRDACLAAAYPALVGCGVTVLMSGQLHAARYVTKVHSQLVDAFASPPAGPLALYGEGQWHWLRRASRREMVEFQGTVSPVELLKLTVDGGPQQLEAAGTYARGIVIEGLGNGHAPPAIQAILLDLARRGMPVVMTSRCLSGGASGDVAKLIYTELPGPKARILLMLALSCSQQIPVLQRLFAKASDSN